MPTSTLTILVALLAATITLAAVVPTKDCTAVTCAKGETCENGTCKKVIVQAVNPSDSSQFQMCPSVNSLKPIACGDSRPTEGDCPRMTYYYVTP